MNADVIGLNGSIWYEFLNFSFINTFVLYLVANGNIKFEFSCSDWTALRSNPRTSNSERNVVRSCL